MDAGRNEAVEVVIVIIQSTRRRAIARRRVASFPLRLALLMVWWLLRNMPGKSYRGELPPADGELKSLARELRRDVARLADEIGERNVRNRPRELSAAADLVQAELAAAGYAVQPQAYQIGDCTCRNLAVEAAGSAQPEQIVVVGAHYDTVIGTPGANDNTSGIAALLALARRFSGRQIARTLRFVAFVNEEKPYAHTDAMGSRVYSRRCAERAERITAMLSLETIGYYDHRPGSQKYPRPFGVLYPSEGNFIAFVGNIQSRKLVRRAVAAFRRHEPFPSEGAALPAFVYGVGFSDHWSFWQEGYPAVMVTDTAMFRYPYYHQPDDTTDKLDFDGLARVVRGLDGVVASLVCDTRCFLSIRGCSKCVGNK